MLVFARRPVDAKTRRQKMTVDVDEGKKTEEEAGFVAQVQAVLNMLPAYTWYAAPRGALTFVNRRTAEYLGIPNDHPLRFGIDVGAEWDDWVPLLHPDDQEEARKYWSSLLRTGEGGEHSYRVRSAQGDYRWFLTRIEPLRASDGALLLWFGATLDIEERKCAEQALRESEYKLRQIIDTIPAHVVRYRPDGAADFMNQTFGKFVGPGVGFDNLGSVVHPEDYPERSRDWDIHVAAAEPYDIEMRLRRADGVYRWHRSRRVPLRDASGAIVNWYGAGHDIDDQKQAEQALRRSEAHLAEAQRLSHTGASAYNATTILYWSEENYRIFGFDPRDGLPDREAASQRIHPDDRNLVLAEVEDALNGKGGFSSEFRIVLPDGTVKYLESIRKPVFSTNGELVEVVATQIDVTERKRVEEAYREAQLELAHANRVATMGQLTASITHEVNQPITAAVTYALAARRFLSAEPPNFCEVDDALSLIIKEGNRAGEVVKRVRGLVKKVPARKDAVAIDDAILEVIALTRAEAAKNSVSVRTLFAEGLPRVQGDRIQLQQVMLNLIVNAIQAMSGIGEGARELQISIDAVPPEGGVRVGVRDTGPGLSPESLSCLFEPFYTTKSEGMGIGLSICRSIIEAHGGRLWATPCDPQGALFQFTIPAD
jgi:PAS domain S-box-containing protein